MRRFGLRDGARAAPPDSRRSLRGRAGPSYALQISGQPNPVQFLMSKRIQFRMSVDTGLVVGASWPALRCWCAIAAARWPIADTGCRQPSISQEAQIRRHGGGVYRQRLRPTERAPGAEVVPADAIGPFGGGSLDGRDIAGARSSSAVGSSWTRAFMAAAGSRMG
jgi:hypothetical protein